MDIVPVSSYNHPLLADILFKNLSVWHHMASFYFYTLRLREAVVQSEAEKRALVRCQLELQKNIEIKASSLYIDEVICTQHKESVVIHNF